MKEYLKALNHCFENGSDVKSRNGDVRRAFGYQMRFNLEEGFPILTTKKMAWRSIVSELLWFLEGSSDERRLAEIHYSKPKNELKDKKTIWTQNANADYWKAKAAFDGDLGRIYGVQWRDFGGIDQVQSLIKGLQNDPNSRRHIISSWNPSDLQNMALPPCHIMAQFFVHEKRLSCQLYQRSCDMFLGVPFNISSYSLLTHIIAKECGFFVGEFIHTLGDYHIYHRHFSQVKEQIKRKEKNLPELRFKIKNIFEYFPDDFVLENYDPHPAIKAEMNV
ncbi:MAG: Thymidylate synthase 2 [Alphaproteobacteria bacterium MarineAlpha5_Bin11]|nr:thymidylate synthase [Pelagibacteraceae bacterium]PPR43732.1 MAG: Thymidylate synthase 2 [Alphaproteobacteria bacterium MarineAlpha5_Bin11]PPR50512.1 MAG: Thymidylate synthase 2 [Alphaproteobacteria bacterium MarineAlpha5_Bin10]|tara:strand:- start:598 stop:1428 length:831 start_codon:yes stop_codon:yes gene_type:complete